MKKWSIIVKMKGSDTWFRNGKRFDSFQEAEEHGHNQYMTHAEITEWHIVPAPEETDTDT